VTNAGASVMTGRRIGVYQIMARVGAGGMGEVYRARDTRLGRDVTIKILPRAFTADADRLTRFEREARVLASLNHPNIAAIHGIEDAPLDDGRTSGRSCWNWSTATRSRTGSPTRAQKGCRPKTRSTPRTRKGSSTAI
jgi:serine/threonine protein kinase